jgi:hypothetical protein
MTIALHLVSVCLKALISIAWLTYNIFVAIRLGRGYALNLSLSLVLMMSTVLRSGYGIQGQEGILQLEWDCFS